MRLRFQLYCIFAITIFLYCSTANAYSWNDENLLYDENLHVFWLKTETLRDALADQEDKVGTRQDALDWINGLNTLNDGMGAGGYTDWRLPSYDQGELESLYNLLTPIADDTPYEEYCFWYEELVPDDDIPQYIKDILDTDYGWAFDFRHGTTFYQSVGTEVNAYALLPASSVPLPLPSSAILFLAGLLVLARSRSSQKN